MARLSSPSGIKRMLLPLLPVNTDNDTTGLSFDNVELGVAVHAVVVAFAFASSTKNPANG